MSARARFARGLLALVPAAVTLPVYATNEAPIQALASEAAPPVAVAWETKQKQRPVQLASLTTGAPRVFKSAGIQSVTASHFADVAGRRVFGDEEDGYDTVANEEGGKLFITARWADGRETKHELNYTARDVYYDDWGPFVVFYWDVDKKQFVLDPPKLPLYPVVRALELYAGAGKLKHEAPGIGVNVGPDTRLLQGAESITFNNLGFGLSLGRIGNYAAKLNADFKWGDETTRNENSTGVRGATFQGGLSPAGGTGFATVAPSVASLETKYDAQQLTFTASRPFPRLELTDKSRAMIAKVASVARMSLRYDGDMQFPAIPTLFAEENTKVTEWTVGLGLGANGRHYFDNGVSASGGILLSAYYYRGKYEGRHHYVLPGQDFRQTTSDRTSGVTWGGSANAALHYRVNRNTEITIRGDYMYRDKSVFVQEKTSPTAAAPHAATSDTQSTRVALSVRIGF